MIGVSTVAYRGRYDDDYFSLSRTGSFLIFRVLSAVINTIRRCTIMAKVELKQPIVDEIKELLDGAQSMVLVDYRGLTVAQDTVLRKELRENGVVYKVYKNTLIKRAIEGTEFEGASVDLEEPTAIAVSKTDATAPARILAKFAKTADKLEIKSGVVEGTYYDKDAIKTIANIPSREELLSKLLGSMQSPIANFARVIKQIAEKQEA
jgi:large subunit ribosomal protein L10